MGSIQHSSDAPSHWSFISYLCGGNEGWIWGKSVWVVVPDQVFDHLYLVPQETAGVKTELEQLWQPLARVWISLTNIKQK